MVCEYNRTDIAGETLRKIKTGSGFYFENSMFHSLPLLDLKGYEQDSFSYRFLKVSTVFRHSFRLLFWKMSQNDNIASSGHMSFARATDFGQPLLFPLLFPLLLWKTFAVDILYYRLYIWKTTRGLIIKNFDMFLWTLCKLFGIFVRVVATAISCGFLNITRQTNGGILDQKIIFMEQKLLNCAPTHWEPPPIHFRNVILHAHFSK